jgi:hypothetical protein
MSAQNAQFWMVERLDRHQADVVQNGGSARGYQGLPAPSAIPTTATQTAARLYFYASPALGVNFLFCMLCRRPGEDGSAARRAGRRLGER